jgi:hypothetical protein
LGRGFNFKLACFANKVSIWTPSVSALTYRGDTAHSVILGSASKQKTHPASSIVLQTSLDRKETSGLLGKKVSFVILAGYLQILFKEKLKLKFASVVFY